LFLPLKLIRNISFANPLWGAPRIHGELPKLGIDIGWCRPAFIQVNMRSPCKSMICLAFEIAKATASSLL